MSSSAEAQLAMTSKVCPVYILSNSALASTSGSEQQSPEQSKTFFFSPSFAMLILSQ
ncbi:hypothetical protein MUO71_06555 [Candidatus Bathyarchaeota archaeon]|nr:hypothetical protein [Candidatus Bathyarchaeota archaeon]